MATEIEMLIRARNEAEAALKSVQGDLKQIDSASKSVNQSFKDAGASMAKLGVGLSATVTAPVVALGVSAVNSAAEFEQALSVLGQVTGASASALAGLQTQALQLGAETSFSAGEAAQAMLELGKAGLDTTEIAASIGGVLDLAAAGNLGLAQAAEIAANAVNMFGLDASQSSEVANLLAAAANASSVDVTDLAMAMKMSGTVFASNGQSIDDMTVALSLLGNNAMKGSDAGTSLKTMLMRLTAPLDEAKAALASMNVEVYNADGSMRAFPDILDQMRTGMQNMTDEQRNMALTTIFGADAIRAANILVEEGGAAWDEMAEAVSKNGAATALADARMSGVAGAFEYFKGTLESTLIEAVLPYMGGINRLIRQAADFIGQFAKIPPNIRGVILGVAAAAAAIGPLLIGLGMVTSAIGAAMPIISAIGSAFALLSNPIGWLVAGLAALGVAWATNFLGIRDLAAPAVAAVTTAFQSAMTAVQEFGQSSTWTGLVETVTDAGAGIAEAMGDLFSGELSLPDLAGQIGEQMNNIGLAIGEALASPDIAALGSSLAATFGLDAIIPTVTEAATNVWNAITGVFSGEITLADIGAAVKAKLDAGLETARGAAESLWAAVAGAFGTDITLADIGAAIKTKLDGAVETVRTAATNLWSAVTGVFSGEITLADIGAAIKARLDAGLETARGAAESLWSAVTGVFGTDITLADVGAAIKEKLDAAVTTVSTAATNLWSTVTGAFGTIDLGDIGAAIGAQLDAAVATVGTAATNVWNAITGAFGGEISLGGLGAQIQQGLTDIAGQIKTLLASETFSGLGPQLTTALGLDTLVDNVAALQTSFQPTLTGLQEAFGVFVDYLAEPAQRLKDTFIATLGSFGGMGDDVSALGNSFGELGKAFSGLLAALGMEGGEGEGIDWMTLLGGTVIGTITLALNILTASLTVLGVMATFAINQLKTTIEGITGVVKGFTTIITGIKEGDWSLVFAGIQETFSAFQTWIAETVTNITTTLSELTGAIGGIFTNTLKDMGFDEASEKVGGFVASVQSFIDTVAGISSGTITLDWTWPPLPEFTWPTWPEWEWVGFAWPKWEWVGFAWPKWEWVGFAWPKWEWVGFEWPEIPVPDWLGGLVNALSGGGGSGASSPYVPPGGTNLPIDVNPPYPSYPGQQLGTNYFAGGLTWVGEMGPELLSLPRGSRVETAREVAKAAGAAAANWTFNLYGNIRGEDDILQLAYEVADIIDRRR